MATKGNTENTGKTTTTTKTAAQLERELDDQHDQFLAILGNFPEILYVADPESYEVLFANDVLQEALGSDPTGKRCYEALQGLDAPCEFCTNEQILAHREPFSWEFHNEPLDRDFLITDQIIRWPDGRDVRFEHAVDITRRKQLERELAGHREHLEELVAERTRELERAHSDLQRQAEEILELSTPVMPVWEGVIVAPLIGALDSGRTEAFMARLLEAVVAHRTRVALVDITGVPAVDSQTAQYLIETTAAVQLLGAKVVLTGIRPAIARTLVHLGVDLGGMVTRSSLAEGFRTALELAGDGGPGGAANGEGR